MYVIHKMWDFHTWVLEDMQQVEVNVSVTSS